ncbi:MAG: hypothetical protein HY873_14235 [Chloroflexi bacterium]|nr:hypothetical protein [Chloroflexota bacterium]
MENPELLFGIPLLIIGALGLLVAIEMLLAGAAPKSKTEAAVRAGIMAFVGLAAATVAEYFIATGMSQAMALLIIIALFKAAVIFQFFMHVMRLQHAHAQEE